MGRLQALHGEMAAECDASDASVDQLDMVVETSLALAAVATERALEGGLLATLKLAVAVVRGQVAVQLAAARAHQGAVDGIWTAAPADRAPRPTCGRTSGSGERQPPAAGRGQGARWRTPRAVPRAQAQGHRRGKNQMDRKRRVYCLQVKIDRCVTALMCDRLCTYIRLHNIYNYKPSSIQYFQNTCRRSKEQLKSMQERYPHESRYKWLAMSPRKACKIMISI